jgi:hypothetical protein
MTNQELLTLSGRFQNASRVFSATFFAALPLSVAQAMDQSPRMLTLLELQLATAAPTSGSFDSIRLGTAGEGTTNGSNGQERSIILVDPNDFATVGPSSTRVDSGTFALRIAHEIGHTIDPAGSVAPDNYTDPLSYARARSRGEGHSLVTELSVYDDWATNSQNPYQASRISLDATLGNRGLASSFFNIQTAGQANGLSQSQIDEQLLFAAASANGASSPSSEPLSTYFKQDIRDYVLYTLGIKDYSLVRTIPSQYFTTPVVEDYSTGLWSSSFTINDQNGRYTTYTRASNGEMVRERFTRDGNLIDSTITPDGKLSTVKVSTPSGDVFRVSAPTGELIGSYSETPEGLKEYRTYGFSGDLLQTTSIKQYDDGSSIATTTTREGVVVIKSYDTDNQLAGTITDTPDGAGGMNRLVSTTVNGNAVQITQHASATALGTDTNHDGNNNDPRDYVSTGVTINGTPAVNNSLIAASIDDNYASANDIIRARGTGNLNHIVTAGNGQDADGVVPSPADLTGLVDWFNSPEAQGFGVALGDVTSLVGALRSGRPLSIATSGFNILSHYSDNPTVRELASTLSTIGSVAGLVKALETGDLGRILIDGGGAARSAITIANNALTTQMISQYSNDDTMYSIAAPAIFYWSAGLNGIENRAQNDEFWRSAA